MIPASSNPPSTFTAFDDGRAIAAGTLSEVALAMRREGVAEGPRTALIFRDDTGAVVDFDLGGTDEEIVARAPRVVAALQRASEPRSRGRPRLGVVSREVTLLPRHWAWLSAQRGGASATLRRLVDDARRMNHEQDAIRGWVR